MPTAEPGPARELKDAARSLAAVVRARALQTERDRRLAAGTIAEMKASGLTGILQPRRCGGLELDYRVHLDVVEELARGCGSTAWCLGTYHIASWLAGLFAGAAQDDIYGAGAGALVAAVIAPHGAARRRGDGFALEGVWPYASGCEHADWAILGATVTDGGGGDGDEALFAVPMTELEIHDDWHAAGLRGSGSCSVGASGVAVPAHRSVALRDAGAGRAPGRGLHASALYRAPLVPCLALALCAPAVGLAAAAVAELAGAERIDAASPLAQQAVGGACAGVDTARALLRRSAGDIHEAAERRGRMTRAVRARVRMDCAYAVSLCREAVAAAFLAGGGAALSDRDPVQRAWRDVHAIGQHALLRLGAGAELYGRTLLGLDPATDVL